MWDFFCILGFRFVSFVSSSGVENPFENDFFYFEANSFSSSGVKSFTIA